MEERDRDLVGVVTAAILDAVWPVGVGVKSFRPAARQTLRSNTNNACRAECPNGFAAVQIYQAQLPGES